jgi:hypothetical protein
MVAGDGSKGIYDHLYRRFFANRDRHKGYDFQDAPAGSAQVPRVTFQEKLRWWTLDRWRRRKKILIERDRLQREIIDIKNGRSKDSRR